MNYLEDSVEDNMAVRESNYVLGGVKTVAKAAVSA